MRANWWRKELLWNAMHKLLVTPFVIIRIRWSIISFLESRIEMRSKSTSYFVSQMTHYFLKHFLTCIIVLLGNTNRTGQISWCRISGELAHSIKWTSSYTYDLTHAYNHTILPNYCKVISFTDGGYRTVFPMATVTLFRTEKK